MDRARNTRNYDLHSWTGVTLGLFVYIVCFSGSLALFFHEIQVWEDPAKRIELPAEPIAIDPAFTAWVEDRAREGDIEALNLRFPTDYDPYYRGFAHVHTPDGGHHDHFVSWAADTGQELPERGEGAARWLYDFHRDLMWPAELGGRTIGRAIVGVAGVILMLSIITGIVAHTKIFQELFTLRYMRSVRLKWQDTHKVLGLWGTPFYAMIAFTGAFLGIVAILAPIIAVLAFKGDQGALIEAVVGQPPPPAGVEARMLSVDEVAALRHPESGEDLSFVVVHHWGDAGAVFDLYYDPDTELKSVEAVSISGVSGAPVVNDVTLIDTPANRVTAAVTPLHYGTFGGIALKYLYLVLGMALSVITALGVMMWIERRLHGNEGRRSAAFYRGLGNLTVGVTTGIGIASVTLLYHNALYSGPEASRLVWTGWTYFGVWFAVIAYACIRRDDYRATREMIGLGGLGLLGLPVFNGVMTGDFVWGPLVGDGHGVTAGVDLAFLVLGVITLAIAAALPVQRAERKSPRTALAPEPAE